MIKNVPYVFYTLCKHFFDENGTKKKFKIENKVSVISDPFVEYISENIVFEDSVKMHIAPSYVSPDILFYSGNMDTLFGLEVKTSKSKSGGINFNSSLPCGKIIVDINEVEQIIPCYYLFVHLVEINNENEVNSIMMVDGDFINSDFDLYIESIGIRKKKIDVGSYGDGINKQRNMFMFPNPLSIPGLRSERSTLIVKEELYNQNYLGKVAIIQKTEEGQVFYAYQSIRKLVGPFCDFSARTENTKPRNKLKLNL